MQPSNPTTYQEWHVQVVTHTKQCDALQDAGLRDRILFPADPGYEAEIETWPAENGRQRPYCLVLPYTTEEVATALTALVEVDSGAGDWHIAVRSGGHSYAGSNNIDRGVTIDLSMMNSSSYDAETNLARIQPGGRWKKVYADLEEEGVVVAGGRDGGVGVGGFLLGGGISFFSGRMGLGCDSVVNYEVVLANGTVVNANSTANADLWRALKGGSSNFGIVTRYDMEALPSRALHYDLRTFGSNYTDAVIDAAVGFSNQDEALGDNSLVTLLNYEPAATADITMTTIYVNTAGAGNVTTAFDPLKKLPALSATTTSMGMAKAAAGSQIVDGTKNAGSTLTFNNDPQILRRVVELTRSFTKNLDQLVDPMKVRLIVFLQPFPTYIAAIGKKRGGNMLGLDEVPNNAIMFTTGLALTNATDKEFAVAQAWLMQFTAQVKEISTSMDGAMDFIYLNYAYPFQDPIGTYGSKNIQHIRDVAAAYDPTGVFQKRVPGGFKISRTKCDRQSPCASCVTLKAACRTTGGASEKRQRVLLSSKYEDAMQDVNRQLAEVKMMLQSLTLGSQGGKDLGGMPAADLPPGPGPSPRPTTATVIPSIVGTASSPASSFTDQHAPHAYHTPRSIVIDELVPSLSSVNEGYNGDSSFQSHVHQVKSALEEALAASELMHEKAASSAARLPPQKVQELLRGVAPGGEYSIPDHQRAASAAASAATPQLRQPGVGTQHHDHDRGGGSGSGDEFVGSGSIPLPPMDVVLRLLRLTKTDKQRFFVDVPLIQEDEFSDMCRDVYFATRPVSLPVWICVNAGLYFLFIDIGRASCARMGVAVEDMRSHVHVLAANAEAALQSLRLCSEPSVASCRALALLADSPDIVFKHTVFWYIYAWDKGLAITCGRTPVIHQYDVTSNFRICLLDETTAHGRAFLDYAVMTGEIQQDLFSASAQRASQSVRIEHVRTFASRIRGIQETVRSVSENRNDPSWDDMHGYAISIMELRLHSLLTLVYRILPPSSAQAHPLQCADECVEAARMALSTLVKVGNDMMQITPKGWRIVLNVVLSLVPFVSFIVLAGNAIATTSAEDVALLSSAVSVLAPVADDSPTIKKMHDACDRFSRIAGLIVSNAYGAPSFHQEQQRQAFDDACSPNGPTIRPDMHPVEPIDMDYSLPMAQEDWDTVMMGFESELGDYDSRTLANIIEPYITNPYW
ncbi:hypothetical protein SLS62_003594 [Diatrype stigma]|uniref:FAD-binding PCMH-type domain-containing protein n=1 Tax=Diatrype stigma TaxID=117547 RepID=A0AAN9UUN1_9PEZI